MDEDMPLKITHDVSQSLQRKLEGKSSLWKQQTGNLLNQSWLIIGLADVERAYVHVDYENDHDIKEEHKPLYEVTERRSIKQRVKQLLSRSKKEEAQ